MNALDGLGREIVGINTQGFLIFIDIVKNVQTLIWESSISHYSTFSFAGDTMSGLIIAGDRTPGQIILHLQSINRIVFCKELTSPKSLVLTACMDYEGRFLLLSTQARELLLINMVTEQFKKVSYRLGGGLPVRGTIVKSSLTTLNNSFAALATDNGELLFWDTSLESIGRIGSYKGLKEQTNIEAIEFIPDSHNFVWATNQCIEVISIRSDISLVTRSPISHCCLSDDGWLITINEHAKKVTWFKDLMFIADFFYMNFQPSAIASIGNDGYVIVGYKNGSIIKLMPKLEPGEDDGIILYDEPIISIENLDNNRIVVAK
ncbi:MAG: hypothetical protein IPO69_22130 [Saprospiraceae bacterium]|nr:hypothetical protein [Saprospiraceae bacterium]